MSHKPETKEQSGAIENIVPAKLYVTYCPVCRRNDLVSPLKARHSSGGKLCRGILRQVSYTLDGEWERDHLSSDGTYDTETWGKTPSGAPMRDSFTLLRAEAARMNPRELRETIDGIRGNPKRGPRRGFTKAETLALTILLDEEARRVRIREL